MHERLKELPGKGVRSSLKSGKNTDEGLKEVRRGNKASRAERCSLFVKAAHGLSPVAPTAPTSCVASQLQR